MGVTEGLFPTSDFPLVSPFTEANNRDWLDFDNLRVIHFTLGYKNMQLSVLILDLKI